MTKMNKILLICFLGAIFVFYLTGTSNETNEINNLKAQVKEQIHLLKTSLDNHTIRNTEILKYYSETIRKSNPDLSSLADKIYSDASSNGDLFNSYLKEFGEIDHLPNREQKIRKLHELKSKTSLENYSIQLIQDINLLADLSDGKLAKINNTQHREIEPRKIESYIGNSQYGYWRENNGMSIWEWYGAYSMLRDFLGLGTRPIYQNEWHRYGPSIFDRQYAPAGPNFWQEDVKPNQDANRRYKSFESSKRRSSVFAPSNPSSRSIINPGSSSRRSSSFGKRR